jgi:hypothetical protein
VFSRQQFHPATRWGDGLDVLGRTREAMTADTSSAPTPRQAALRSVADSAAANIPGVDFASITVKEVDGTLRTLAATDPLAENVDALQYELREGPCYAAVTVERFVLVNDMAAAGHAYPRFSPRAAELGVRAQAAIQLLHEHRERAGLNRTPGIRGPSTGPPSSSLTCSPPRLPPCCSTPCRSSNSGMPCTPEQTSALRSAS